MILLKISLRFILYLAFPILFSACAGGYYVTNYTTHYTAIYMSYADLRGSFKVQAAQELHNPGKIAISDDYVFLNEQDKGIHIIDNKNPLSPQPIAFLCIPGSYDLAVKDGYLYADSFIDIVVIDIGGLPYSNSISLVGRLENIIPYNPLRNIGELIYDNHAGLFFHINDMDHNKGVVIGWESKVVSSKQWVPHGAVFSPPAPKGETGLSGSLTRFIIKKDFLYTVDEKKLNVFSLAGPPQPRFLNSQPVERDETVMQTIFAYEQYLFLASQTGMYVYSIEHKPDKPEFVSSLTHARSRDPVIVHDDLAYVTLAMGELQIIDVSDIHQPKLIKRYGCREPRGLSMDMPYLFIAAGTRMLVYDVTDPEDIKLLSAMNYPAGSGYEVIAYRKRLYIVTTGGFFQCDYSDIEDIKLLSSLHSKQKHR